MTEGEPFTHVMRFAFLLCPSEVDIIGILKSFV